MDSAIPWSAEAFEGELRRQGASYHSHHPYHQLMVEGSLDREQIRGWVANRFYYQISIPRKDAAILANCPDRAVRRIWIQRILDHDGHGDEEGGIARWERLGEACGLSRERLWSGADVVPGVRFAVDAYVDFARRSPWQDAVCASLTELFAGDIHRSRLESWPRHYPWIPSEALDYFRQRVGEAGRDVDFSLRLTLDHFRSRPEQERALGILRFKLDVLWSMLDAIHLRYIGRPAPTTESSP